MPARPTSSDPKSSELTASQATVIDAGSNEVRHMLRPLLARLEPVLESLSGEARVHAARICQLGQQISARSSSDPMKLSPEPGDPELRRELAQLVELNARRGAFSIPFATLGRSLLAELSNDRNAFRNTCRECEGKLAALGY